MTVNQRIKYLIEELGYNKNSFSKALGLSNNVTIGNIVSNRGNKPSFDVLERILQKFDSINTEWLMLGKGEPFIKMVIPADNVINNDDHVMDKAVHYESLYYYPEIVEEYKKIISDKDEIINFLKEKNIQLQRELDAKMGNL